MSTSAGFCYFDKCEMFRAVYGCDITIDDTTGQLIDIVTSCSPYECIALKMSDAVLKVIPVLFKSDEVPTWAISSPATTTLDVANLQQNNIDLTSLGLGHSVKIALVPCGAATTFHRGDPVDNLNMADANDVSLLAATHGAVVAFWAETINHALNNGNHVIARQVLGFLQTTANEEALQLGPKTAEFANLHWGYEPTLPSLNITSLSHPTEFKALLDRLGGPEKPAAVPTVSVNTPASPSVITIVDRATEKEEVLYKNGHSKNTIIYLGATINEKDQTLENVAFGEPTAALVTIMALKTGEDKSEGIVSLFNTNSRHQKALPSNEYDIRIQKRDCDHYCKVMGAAFLSGNVSSTKMDGMNKSSNQSGLSIVHYGKLSKAIIEALQQEGQRQLLETAIGESEGNATKKRTTFHPADFFNNVGQVACLLANFMNCVEAAWISSVGKQPVLYQVAERFFRFCIDPKTIEWSVNNPMPGLAMLLVSLMDELYASAAEMGGNYVNRLAKQTDKPEDLVTDGFKDTVMKVLDTLRELIKKRDWKTPWTSFPTWITKMKEIAEPEAGFNTSERSLSPNKRKFDRDKPNGDAPPTGGPNVSWRDTTPARGGAPPIVPGQATQPSGRGRLRESGDGGIFARPPSRNGCYLLMGMDTKPELALCPEARSEFCGHHAVVHKMCGDKECKKGHKWWHEYSDDLKAKQLLYMAANPTVVKFSPKATATIRALPSGKDHLIGGEN